MKRRKVRVKVSATSTVHTFAYLRNVSWHCRKRAAEESHGSNLFASSSMIFSAFSVEAYLNYLGSEVLHFWSSIERKLSPKEKLDLLAQVLSFRVDYGARPFRTFVKMFAFRNSLAHGRTEELTRVSIQLLAEDEVPQLPQTSWQEEISVDTASRYLDDSKAITETLAEKANLDPTLLLSPGDAGWVITPEDGH